MQVLDCATRAQQHAFNSFMIPEWKNITKTPTRSAEIRNLLNEFNQSIQFTPSVNNKQRTVQLAKFVQRKSVKSSKLKEDSDFEYDDNKDLFEQDSDAEEADEENLLNITAIGKGNGRAIWLRELRNLDLTHSRDGKQDSAAEIITRGRAKIMSLNRLETAHSRKPDQLQEVKSY